VNPITGIRARRGGAYEMLLNAAGVGQQGQGQDQAGTVNPITGLRARRGGAYEMVLNAAGVSGGGQAGVGLFGNNALVQAINRRGGLLAVATDNSVLPTTTSSQPSIPGWAVAGLVLLTIVIVLTIVVMVQLVILIRRS